MVHTSCSPKYSSKFSETNALSQLFQINAVIFLLSSIIISFKQLYSPIDCLYDGMLEQQKAYVDNYCWRNFEHIVSQPQRMSGPTVPDARSNMPVPVFIIPKKPSTYLRWFPLILLLQALLAYLPTWLWKNVLRDGRLQETIFSIKNPMKPNNRRKLLIINLANDLFADGIQRRYAKPFFLVEFLNIITLFLNIFLTNFILQNQFFTFGLSELGMRFRRSCNIEDSDTCPSNLFPTFAKCSVRLAKKSSGSSIHIQKEEAICMVSFNSLCESIFMFFWVWFCILILASVCGISYRVFIIFSRRKRKKLLMQAVDKSFEEKLSQICEKLSLYSWFTLYRISRNVDPLTFQDIVSSLMVRLDSSNTNLKSINGLNSSKEGGRVQYQNDLTSLPDPGPTSTLRKNRNLATIV